MTAPADAPAIVVDALGCWCPLPVLLAGRALRRLTPGATMLVLADDPLVTVDLPAWAQEAGAEVLSIVQDASGGYRALVRHAGGVTPE